MSRMTIITMPVAKGRAQLCSLIEKVKAGATAILTNHGKPEVVITAYRDAARPWRVDKPDDPARYGDLQSPVMEDWQ